MIIFFGLVALFGAAMTLADFAAKSNSVAPSMYRSDGTYPLIAIIGLIGMICAKFGP